MPFFFLRQNNMCIFGSLTFLFVLKPASMKKYAYLTVSLLIFMQALACTSTAPSSESDDQTKAYEYALVLHGGAGYMNFQNVPEEAQEMFEHALDSALQLGLDLRDDLGPRVIAVVFGRRVRRREHLIRDKLQARRLWPN